MHTKINEHSSDFKDETLLTTIEACEIAKVSRWTLSRWLKAGKIKAIKFGKSRSSGIRFFRRNLLEFLASMTMNVSGGEA